MKMKILSTAISNAQCVSVKIYRVTGIVIGRLLLTKLSELRFGVLFLCCPIFEVSLLLVTDQLDERRIQFEHFLRQDLSFQTIFKIIAMDNSWITWGVWGAILLFGAKFVIDRVFKIPIPEAPQRKRKLPEKRDYTREELKQYDGSDPEKPILLAVKGKIYDVSSREMFYGPGGAYNVFTGKDASRALGKGVTDPEEANNPRWDDLSPVEMDTLNEWAASYEFKYPFVGNVVDTQSTDST